VRWFARLAALAVLLAGLVGTAVASAAAAGSGATPVAAASSTASARSDGALTVPAPAGVRAGDLLLASIAIVGGTGPVIAPSGWSEVPGAEAHATPTGVRTESFDMVAGASSPFAFTFTASGDSPGTGTP
jgi:hypothetical protein